ncbi:hypothetical protein NL676_000112 [Syzygium grande]|nr:hypothetical protein NL676_000112 [Syzygium grande]
MCEGGSRSVITPGPLVLFHGNSTGGQKSKEKVAERDQTNSVPFHCSGTNRQAKAQHNTKPDRDYARTNGAGNERSGRGGGPPALLRRGVGIEDGIDYTHHRTREWAISYLPPPTLDLYTASRSFALCGYYY